ncbi:MAG: trehalase-like domain-containing protein, partial [Streptosporangiaceae bacterium]
MPGQSVIERYPNIGDHGLIGDLQTAALVSTDGTIDWFCCPRFDSPSVFGSLLDSERGGYFRIRPTTESYVTRQLYFPDTAMLITRFMTEDGVGEVTDFMPIAGGQATDRHRLVRQLRTVRGQMRFEAEIRPRFDYGRAKHRLEVTEDGLVFRSEGADGMELTLNPTGARKVSPGQHSEPGELDIQRLDGNDLRVSVTLREGETAGVVLESMGGTPHRIRPEELHGLVHDTSEFWRNW